MGCGQTACYDDEKDCWATVEKLKINKCYLDPKAYTSYSNALKAYGRMKGVKDIDLYNPKTLRLIKPGDEHHYWYWTVEAIDKLVVKLRREQQTLAQSPSRGCADAD